MGNDNVKLGPGMALASLQKLFSPLEIQELYEGKRVGTIDIEITDKCNFKCKYCYASCSPKGNTKELQKRLSMSEIKSLLDQASALDIRLFNIQGGEPMLDKKKFYEVANYARPKFKSLVAFTNGSLITEEDAKKIADLDMALCVKLDTLDPEIHKELTQTNRSLEHTIRGFELLKKYGVTVSTNSVATPLNYSGIPNAWRYAVDMGFTPFVARNHFHGHTRDNPELQLTAEELGNLFKELERIDKEEYGIDWPVSTLWPRGNSCQRYRAGVFVNYYGLVLPCSEADPAYFTIGNGKKESLKDILTEERLAPFRNIYDKLHGACHVDECEYAKEQQCYGCRVSAADIGVFRGLEFKTEFFGGDALCPYNHKNPLTAKELGREPLPSHFDLPKSN
jgi:MoaA/NifB/PqqE/SkfB family radical SAM enzyme